MTPSPELPADPGVADFDALQEDPARWIGVGLVLQVSIDRVGDVHRSRLDSEPVDHELALPELPQHYQAVMKTEGAKFNTLFHGLLDRGVYIAPALYEAGFVSAAHSEQDIAETVAAAREVFRQLVR